MFCAIGSGICAFSRTVQARFPHAECRTSASRQRLHSIIRTLHRPRFRHRALRPSCRIEARLVAGRQRLALASDDGLDRGGRLREG